MNDKSRLPDPESDPEHLKATKKDLEDFLKHITETKEVTIIPWLTLEQEWEQFHRAVLPNGAPEVQLREMRRAFYGGMIAMLAKHSKLADFPEDFGVKILQSMHTEMGVYVNNVATGNE